MYLFDITKLRDVIASCPNKSSEGDSDNIVTIRSTENVLCNYYTCEVRVYSHTFRLSEHVFQLKFYSHVGSDDLAQEDLDPPSPDQAKERASRLPSHLDGSWHKIKLNVMEEIIEAKQFIVQSSSKL